MDVKIGCLCGGTHPDGDTVTLRDRLDFRSATTIRKAIGMVNEDGDTEAPEILAVMTEWYALLGIEAWTLTDDRGKPLPVTRAAIREKLLDNPDALMDTLTVADAADELYMPVILLPLLVRASTSSLPTPTAPSTSAPTDSSEKPPKPSKRSSTTSTRTDGIATITSLPVGDSSTSPSTRSAT